MLPTTVAKPSDLHIPDYPTTGSPPHHHLQGGLDAHCTYSGPLGSWQDGSGAVHIALWAPTATNVQLLHWEGAYGGEVSVWLTCISVSVSLSQALAPVG